MEREGSGGSSGGSAGLLQQILSLNLNSTSLCSFPEMWYGVFLWALVSLLFFHGPAGLLALFTLRHHKYGAAIAGVYRAAGKEMIPFEAFTLGTGQIFCVVAVSFLWILETL
ncbi:transmembrane protein 170A-like [Ochotona curzoniae]|uniref:transmembrane protein 170A-like n=1 Tax=Ochotona curzoniae TaxID=130825 RepID=UPI001B34BE8F|nr:transmembrane protein 170A-like [Ochotona curzoniae]